MTSLSLLLHLGLPYFAPSTRRPVPIESLQRDPPANAGGTDLVSTIAARVDPSARPFRARCQKLLTDPGVARFALTPGYLRSRLQREAEPLLTARASAS